MSDSTFSYDSEHEYCEVSDSNRLNNNMQHTNRFRNNRSNIPVQNKIKNNIKYIIIVLTSIVVFVSIISIILYFMFKGDKKSIDLNQKDRNDLVQYYTKHFFSPNFDITDTTLIYNDLLNKYKFNSDNELIKLIRSDECNFKFSDNQIKLFHNKLCIFNDKLVVRYNIKNCNNIISLIISDVLMLYSQLNILFYSYHDTNQIVFECKALNNFDIKVDDNNNIKIILYENLTDNINSILKHMLSHIFLGNHINDINSLRFDRYVRDITSITQNDKDMFNKTRNILYFSDCTYNF